LRLVVDDRGHVRADVVARAMGRGAYVCASVSCIEVACGRGGIVRAVRGKVAPTSSDALRRELRQQLQGRIAELEQATTVRPAAVVEGRQWRELNCRMEQLGHLDPTGSVS